MKKILSSKPIIALEIAVVLFFGFQIAKEYLQRRSVEVEIARLEEEISKLEVKNQDLGVFLEYTKTDSFVEEEARKKLNLVQAGESVVVIPEVDVDLSEESQQQTAGDKVVKESNINLWWKYFFDYDQLWLEN